MRQVLRSTTFANVCSFIALVVALGTGGAYAANTVFSTDIVDGQVKTPDLAAGAVTATKVQPETLSSGRVFGLDGSDVDDDGLSGADILESSLARVPDAAKLGGVAAKPAATLVKPAASDHDACSNPAETGTFCSLRFIDQYDWSFGNWGGEYQPARFYRDAFGVVHLEGLITQGAYDSGITPTIFVLPVGSRPAASHVFATIGRETDGSRASLARIDVKPDGHVVLMENPEDDPNNFGGANYVTLDGISFRTG